MKKILILTVTAGEGHNSIAKAIENELIDKCEVRVVDLFKTFSTKTKARFINNGYMWACRNFPNTYNLFFRILQKRNPNRRETSFAQSTIKKETPKLDNLVKEYCPDVIICTHFYPAIILTNLRKKQTISAKVVSILTDYTVHPFHECANGVDYMITPAKFLHEILIRKGYKEEQLKNIGLPVKTEFSNSLSKEVARAKLGLSQELFTVLVMFGGGGFGKNVKTFQKLLKAKLPIQIVVVNGRDEKSKNRIDKILSKHNTIHKVLNLGFTTDISTIMSASDIFVGKCGCITTNEAMNKNLPLILSKKQVAQEYDNYIFLKHNNACITQSNNLARQIEILTNEKDSLSGIRASLKAISTPNATKELVDFCLNLED